MTLLSTVVRRDGMSRAPRLLTAIASLSLIGLFFLPLWRVQLVAPQYPEGLGMRIGISSVRGATPNDLDNINGLNHYIGMRRISPDAIPELRIMPWIVALLIAGGLAAAVLGRPRVLYAWCLGFFAFGAAGLADFWRWEYDYGHHLDFEHAIIKIPGMNYQPPLIGVKQLLNFTAVSWPDSGGWIAFAALALALAAVVIVMRSRRHGGSVMHGAHQLRRGAPVAAAVMIALAAATLPATATAARVSGGAAPSVVEVSPNGPVRSIRDALGRVARGGTIVVHAGTYRDTTIVVAFPVTIAGVGDAILDGESRRQIMTITGDSVTVRGVHFENVGVAFTEDLAAIKVVRASFCTIRDNRIDNAFFGIYLQEASECLLEHNELRATRARDATSGNGIHLWHSREITIVGNRVSGHRDGIYFEFTREAHVRDNLSTDNLRYGLHFMYSDSCDYQHNVFRHNGAGVAVMYSKHVQMTDNRFEGNRGSSAYGLLLKEIADSHLQRNVFANNTTGLVADGATRLLADHNQFVNNGWALKLQASTEDALFTRNDFAGNTFDVATNSRANTSTFSGNYWSAYDGYDLDHDGTGDVPHRPVRLASIVVAQNEPALILLRSNFLLLLDAAERVIPALTPETLADSTPAMRWVQ